MPGNMIESEEELKVGDRIAERYEIQAIVGRGRMGTVYKCRHDVLGRVVAIKTLQLARTSDERMQRRFEREARLASRMEHPNLINVSDFGYTKNGDPYLVMDYVDGTQLFEILNRERCLDPERAISLFMQICDGLYHAHQRDIMHRDLKPANILVTKDSDGFETVKIVDLGVAKMIQHDDGEDQAITKAGEVCGSPVYLSPEQCLYLELDSRTDIYSLGVCLYECLTGQPPLRGSTIYDTLKMHVHEMPLSFSIVAPQLDIPKKLEAVVFRCLEKDPSSRYETMMQVKHELMRSRKSEFDVVSVNVMPPQSLFPPGAKRKTSEISTFLAKLPGAENALPAGAQPDVAATKNSAAALPLIGQSSSMRDSGQFVQMPDPSSQSTPLNDGSSVPFGVSAQQSGQQMQQSGQPTQQAGQSMQQSGPAMQQSAQQLQQSGQPMQQSGQPMQQSGMSMQQSGSPMQQQGPSLQQVEPSMQQQLGSSMQQAGLPMQQTEPSTQQFGPSRSQPSMQQSGSPAQQYDQSVHSSDAPQHRDMNAQGQSMASPNASGRQAQSVQNSAYPEEVPESQSPEVGQGGRKPKSKKSRKVSSRSNVQEQEKNAAYLQQPNKNQSSPGKMIAVFIAACLAVGLSMGVGFATFVNKNTSTPSAQPQEPILQPIAQPSSQQSQLPLQQGKLNNSALAPVNKKAGQKSATPAKSANLAKNTTTAKSGKNAAQVAKKVAPKATLAKHNTPHAAHGTKPPGNSGGYRPQEPTRPGKESHENGVRIIRHPDGTVDVYDSN